MFHLLSQVKDAVSIQILNRYGCFSLLKNGKLVLKFKLKKSPYKMLVESYFFLRCSVDKTWQVLFYFQEELKNYRHAFRLWTAVFEQRMDFLT